MNGILTVWVITWRTVWPVMLIALLLPVVVAVVRRTAQFPPAWALTAPVVAPVLIVIWSGAFWANEAGVRRAVHWTSDVLLALALGGLCILIVVPILARRRPRLWLTVFAAVVNLVFLAAAYFVGSMAISNVWM